MNFAAPGAFLLLLLPLVAFVWRAARAGAVSAAYLPPALAAEVTRTGGTRRRVGLLAPLAVWALVVVALAGPQRIKSLDIITASGRDIVLAIDLSGSMETEDFILGGAEVSRLEAVKSVAARFVEGRAGDRVGLVVFGDKAYVAAPLTHDVTSVAHVVETLTVGVSGRSTAISDGLGLAMKRLDGGTADSRVVILLSDGVDTTGRVDPAEAARLGAARGIRIHTIALGPERAEALMARGRADALDVATLTDVARLSGGEMFRVRSTDELTRVAEAVDRLEPSQSRAPPVMALEALWPWPAGAALALALAVLAAGRRLL
ncbi:VWA domain-containing protein [Acuticoccus yangtzensis]|uniref:VWA domain-containing protein n=1 Tax=Acuticoccus yangtzensis TaxID=1443441 RepID=UPI0009F7ECCE|nr:VWA domain-containing protein [Acuticoccus yangtzensis]ORE91559.1 von Willebrand factor A [Stappia sp. 22II-S9-Z10]